MEDEKVKNKEIIIKGIGNVSVAPDLIVLTMNLENTESYYDQTIQSGAEMLDALRTAITSAGHDSKELKTTRFNIQTAYETYTEKNVRKQRFIGYTCSHGLKLEFDLDMPKLGLTLNAISKSHADPNFNIKFTVKNQNAVSEELLESAAANARQKAEILAKASGVKLGEVQRIDYNWGELHLYSNTDMMFCDALASPMAVAESRMMEFDPEDINVNDSVTMIWEICGGE
jgi:uncharacterized protein YggE